MKVLPRKGYRLVKKISEVLLMKAVIINQARMISTRLPAKLLVCKEFCDNGLDK